MLRYYTTSPQMIPDDVLLSDWLDSSRDHQTCPRWRSSLCRRQPYTRPHRQFTPQFEPLVDLMQLLNNSEFMGRRKQNNKKHENKHWMKTVHLGEDHENVKAKLVDGTVVISTKIDTGYNEYTEVNRVVKLPENIDANKVRMFVKDDDDVVQIEAPYKIHQNEQENEQAKIEVDERRTEQTVEQAEGHEVNKEEVSKIDEQKTECSKKPTDEQLGEQSTEASEQSTSGNVDDKSINIELDVDQNEDDVIIDVVENKQIKVTSDNKQIIQKAAEIEITKLNQHSNNNPETEAYDVEIPVSGFTPDDIKVKVDENQLTIEGKHIIEDESGLRMNSFYKSFSLPNTVNINKLKCSFGDDKLCIKSQ